MKLSKLLEYQKADMERKKLSDEITGNPDYKKMKTYKEEFNSAKQKVSDSESAAASLVSSYNGAVEYFERNAARVEELLTALSSGLDEEEEKRTVAELEALSAAFSEWEKKAAQFKAAADKALMEYSGAQKSGKSARAAYAAAKQNYEKFKTSKEDKLKELKDKCAQLESAVEPELLAVYKSITAENRYPAFVPALGDNDSPVCGACGMMLAGNAQIDLKNNGYCRCETCRRIIYLDK